MKRGVNREAMILGTILVLFLVLLFLRRVEFPVAEPLQEQPAIIHPKPVEPTLTIKSPVPRTFEILLKEDSAEPNALEITQGDTVVWLNYESSTTRKRFWIDEKIYSDMLEPGESYSYVFNEPGEHTFRDVFNGLVRGTINVKPKQDTITGNFFKVIPDTYKGVLGIQVLVLILAIFIVMYFERNR